MCKPGAAASHYRRRRGVSGRQPMASGRVAGSAGIAISPIARGSGQVARSCVPIAVAGNGTLRTRGRDVRRLKGTLGEIGPFSVSRAGRIGADYEIAVSVFSAEDRVAATTCSVAFLIGRSSSRATAAVAVGRPVFGSAGRHNEGVSAVSPRQIGRIGTRRIGRQTDCESGATRPTGSLRFCLVSAGGGRLIVGRKSICIARVHCPIELPAFGTGGRVTRRGSGGRRTEVTLVGAIAEDRVAETGGEAVRCRSRVPVKEEAAIGEQVLFAAANYGPRSATGGPVVKIKTAV